MAPASKAQQKATAKYVKTNYDEIKVRVPKGKKEVIAEYAEKQGQSINSFVNEAIDENMKQLYDEIVSNRDYETLPMTFEISKNAEESIYQFSKTHNIDFDEALELMVQIVAVTPKAWDKELINKEDKQDGENNANN